MTACLSVEIEDKVMVLTIDRPDVRNAMDAETAQAIASALDQLDAEPRLRCAILTGASGTFCSGMDLKAFLRGHRPTVPGRGFGGLAECRPAKLLIAAVEGYALAGGFELVLACDLVVASREARFGLPEVRRGLAAFAGGLLRLPRRLPANVAMEYAVTGALLGAERAHALGLVNRLTEPGGALAEARALAAEVCANGPLAVSVSKQVIVESASWTEAEMFERQRPLVRKVLDSNDAREGATAFAEKRAPVWTGT
jgi:enoyl-CoA hydratase